MMVTKKEIAEAAKEIAGQLKTHESSLINRSFMKSPAGMVLKAVIRNHWMYKKYTENPKTRGQLVRELTKYIDEYTVTAIVQNLS